MSLFRREQEDLALAKGSRPPFESYRKERRREEQAKTAPSSLVGAALTQNDLHAVGIRR